MYYSVQPENSVIRVQGSLKPTYAHTGKFEQILCYRCDVVRMVHEQHDAPCFGQGVEWSRYGQYQFEMVIARQVLSREKKSFVYPTEPGTSSYWTTLLDNGCGTLACNDRKGNTSRVSVYPAALWGQCQSGRGTVVLQYFQHMGKCVEYILCEARFN